MLSETEMASCHCAASRSVEIPVLQAITSGVALVLWTARNGRAFHPSFSSFELISPRMLTQLNVRTRLSAQQNL